jgi:hypothetical protein
MQGAVICSCCRSCHATELCAPRAGSADAADSFPRDCQPVCWAVLANSAGRGAANACPAAHGVGPAEKTGGKQRFRLRPRGPPDDRRRRAQRRVKPKGARGVGVSVTARRASRSRRPPARHDSAVRTVPAAQVGCFWSGGVRCASRAPFPWRRGL